MQWLSKGKRGEEKTAGDSQVPGKPKRQGHQGSISSSKALTTKPCLSLDQGQGGGSGWGGEVAGMAQTGGTGSLKGKREWLRGGLRGSPRARTKTLPLECMEDELKLRLHSHLPMDVSQNWCKWRVYTISWHPWGCVADCRNLVLACSFLLWDARSVSLEAGVAWTVREGHCPAPMDEFLPALPAEVGPPKVAAVGVVT